MRLNPQMFWRAATKRRAAAEVLAQHDPPHFTDAVYLAGYAGECILKALILASIPVSKRPAIIDGEFRGRKGHDIAHLMGLLREQGVGWSVSVQPALRRLAGWSTDLRYETAEFDGQEARGFLSHVDLILDWAKGRLS